MSVLGVLLLVSACGSSGDGSEGDDVAGQGSYKSVKSSVDDVMGTVLPELASAVEGEFPAVRGEFVECGVGPQFQQYSVRGELHSQVQDDAEAADAIKAVLTDAGFDVTVDDDQTVKGTTGGTTVVVLASGGSPIAGGTFIRRLSVDSECQTYSSADADAMRETPVEKYAAVLNGTS